MKKINQIEKEIYDINLFPVKIGIFLSESSCQNLVEDRTILKNQFVSIFKVKIIWRFNMAVILNKWDEVKSKIVRRN